MEETGLLSKCSIALCLNENEMFACVVGAYTHQPLCWSAVTEKPAASVPLPAALCSSSKKGPECTKPKDYSYFSRSDMPLKMKHITHPVVTCRRQWLLIAL